MNPGREVGTSERPDSEAEVERQRRESNELGYRETEEERAYERAQSAPETPEPPDPDEEADVGGG